MPGSVRLHGSGDRAPWWDPRCSRMTRRLQQLQEQPFGYLLRSELRGVVGQNANRVALSLGRLLVVDQVRDLPPDTHDQAEGPHVLLRQVVDDRARVVLDHGLVQHLHGDVLADTQNELRPVTTEGDRVRGPETLHRVLDRRAVQLSEQLVRAAQVQALAIRRAGPAKGALEHAASDPAVDVVAVRLNETVKLVNVAVDQTLSGGGGAVLVVVVRGDRSSADVGGPRRRSVDTEEDRVIDHSANGLNSQGLDLVPNVLVRSEERRVG